jgi:hypothetical protein
VSRRRLANLLLAGLLGAFIAGCGGSATPTAGGATAGGSTPPALPAGTYTSRVFTPAVTATLPTGWWNAADAADYYALQPVASDLVGIHFFRNPKAASQDAACPIAPAPGVGSDSLSLLTWIRSLPGLVVGNPKLVTVGGLSGTEIDVSIADGWKTSCPFASGLPAVPLFVGSSGSLRWVIAGNERLRLDLLDMPSGGTLVVDQDAFDGSLFDALLSAASPVIRSLRVAGT